MQGYGGETEGKRPPGRDAGGWGDNIYKIGCLRNGTGSTQDTDM